MVYTNSFLASLNARKSISKSPDATISRVLASAPSKFIDSLRSDQGPTTLKASVALNRSLERNGRPDDICFRKFDTRTE
ncbi:hypothetical protein H0H87_008079, partial [Tephrocybe sp. NHM501043]